MLNRIKGLGEPATLPYEALVCPVPEVGQIVPVRAELQISSGAAERKFPASAEPELAPVVQRLFAGDHSGCIAVDFYAIVLIDWVPVQAGTLTHDRQHSTL